MTTPLTDPPDESDPIEPTGPICACHGTVDCPDQPTVTIPAGLLADLAELLGVIDEFLRARNEGAADRLADFFARRGEPHPGLTANTLIDRVAFAAADLHPYQQGDRP